ncbi:glycine oxidase ThiO [Williamsia sterculiae]|uniref:glycine oxidase n=1 Tax=Williamsia sterculiae TaxID=1344003 RepID=A0A1N7F1B9_9NOCA|nr:glycine oxidase ThiO [Williamsia sterculiae]SIR94106.1 glycine oxidase [Williamsia sterculiae]
MKSLAVIGGGVIGLTCALRAQQLGWRTTVYDTGTATRASWVAAGMLGSLGEGHPGEDALLELTTASARRWPQFLDELGDPRIRVARDSLFIAVDAADLHQLRSLADFVWGHHTEGVTPVPATEIRELEPAVGVRCRGGYLARGEAALDNRRLLAALESALADAGGTVVPRRIDDPDTLTDDQVLMTAGIGMAALRPELGVHPLKGEVIRLQRPANTAVIPRKVVRARVRGRSVYVVPRTDGVVVGATQYEPPDSADFAPEVAGVRDLLDDAVEVMPGLRDYRIAEIGAGMRPCTPDGLPLVGRLDDRTLLATGHGRNGILLAPLTGDIVAGLLTAESTDFADVTDPGRFACL